MPISPVTSFLSLRIPVERGAHYPVLTHPTSISPLSHLIEIKVQTSTGARPKRNQCNCIFAAPRQHQELISGM